MQSIVTGVKQLDSSVPHVPPLVVPAAARCPYCGAGTYRYDASRDRTQAQYLCGTTTLMLRDDTHIEAEHYADRARHIALWRQRLAREGRQGADPFV